MPHNLLIWTVLGATILQVTAFIHHTVFTDRKIIRRII